MDFLAVFIVGLLTGALNIFAGGGSLITIPLLIFLGVPAVTANCTIRLGIVTQNINASLAFYQKRLLPWREAFFLMVPASLGSVLGSKFVIHMPDEVFTKLLSVALIISLIFMQAKKHAPVQGKTQNKKHRCQKQPARRCLFCHRHLWGRGSGRCGVHHHLCPQFFHG